MKFPRPLIFAFVSVWLAGCGGSTGDNLSVTADHEVAKLQSAKAEAEQAATKAKLAEAKKTKGRIHVEGQ